jgi:histidyl-tRNA synthetase
MVEHLCTPCTEHFAAVRGHLEVLGVPYADAPFLVRGLDYYTRTTFEFFPAGREGQQDAVGGGGRYDGLVELLGGRPTPGIGFALGLDRIVAMLAAQGVEPEREPLPLAVVVGADPAATAARLRLATDLRAAGFAVRADLAPRKLGRQLEAAVKEGARFAVIVGDELADGQVTVRDLDAASQKLVPVADLAALLHRKAAAQ